MPKRKKTKRDIISHSISPLAKLDGQPVDTSGMDGETDEVLDKMPSLAMHVRVMHFAKAGCFLIVNLVLLCTMIALIPTLTFLGFVLLILILAEITTSKK